MEFHLRRLPEILFRANEFVWRIRRIGNERRKGKGEIPAHVRLFYRILFFYNFPLPTENVFGRDPDER